MFPGKGPAFFPGGTLSVWNDVRHIVEAAAAKAADGRPCATMNGKGGAGVLREDVTGRLGGGFLWIFEGNGWDFLINYS